ncbi:unnamed protein product, partial [Rotaria socialis]
VHYDQKNSSLLLNYLQSALQLEVAMCSVGILITDGAPLRTPSVQVSAPLDNFGVVGGQFFSIYTDTAHP